MSMISQMSRSKWELVSTTPRFHDVRAMWFSSEHLAGVLCCACRPLGAMLRQGGEDASEMIILTSKGDFTTWTTVHREAGRVDDISHAGGVLHVIGARQRGDGQMQQLLLRSVDAGASWTTIPLGGPAQRQGLAFVSPRSGYVWSATDLRMTRDGGQTWSTSILSTPKNSSLARPSLGADGTLWLATEDHLYYVREDRAFDGGALPAGLELCFLQPTNAGGVLLLGRAGDPGASGLPVELHERTGSGSLRLCREFPPFLPDYFHASGRFLLITGTTTHETSMRPLLFFSHDAGDTWFEENDDALPVVKGAHFEDGANRLWIRASFDRILRRNFGR
ncbi:WD40/YVTN/BNR-like repeat-containing protein [Polyangium jinanense]|uniref:Uncharacterized protein n=1 Tax=Polyangium jinanense TaxID=2829994 RepID=A0A9X3XAR6_9BACT|nr:hypothetical protein [Polyangium jinanense]MDC3960495.1 hypothetical protein [Polyangium jinanense]MDC3986732.1 hypothetical protein [Polyangium jinanense]